MIDRIRFEAQGLEGGGAGAIGEYTLNGKPCPPKTVVWFEPDAVVRLNPPGGAGYGPARERDPQAVLHDVIEGYVTPEAALRDYGVRVRYVGPADALVRRPEWWQIDANIDAM